MKTWIPVAQANEFMPSGGGCVLIGNKQIAIFNFNKTEWYAVQNRCPHRQQMVLSRGIIGSQQGEHKVTCPLHKNSYSLVTGEHLGGHTHWKLETYAVKVEAGMVYVGIEPMELKEWQLETQSLPGISHHNMGGSPPG